MIVQGNDRFTDMIGALAGAKIAQQRLLEAVEELNQKLKRIESKKTLGMRLTKEENAFWTLYGKKEK